MDFIDNFILPPASREHLLVIKYILIILFTIHFSYLGMITGNSVYSLIFNILDKKKENNLYRRFAKDLMNTVLMNKSLIFVFGIMPLVCINFIYDEILYKSHIMTTVFLIYSSILGLSGVMCLYIYKICLIREKNVNIIAGILSVIFLISGYLIYSGSTDLLLDREKWSIIKEPYQLIFSLNVIMRFLYFLSASFAISGGTILFFFYHWSGGIKDLTEDYRSLINKISVDLTFLFVILQVIFGVLYIITLPPSAMTGHITGPSALILLLSCVISIALYRNDLKFEMPVFVCFLAIFLSMGINDYYTREVAMEEHTKMLISMADKEKELRTGETVVETVADGKSVFKNTCSSCHQYEKKMTGPPVSEFLPKYENKLDELKKYIRNPVKINPEYGVMPRPGLKEEEINAVAEYLLKDYLKEDKK